MVLGDNLPALLFPVRGRAAYVFTAPNWQPGTPLHVRLHWQFETEGDPSRPEWDVRVGLRVAGEDLTTPATVSAVTTFTPTLSAADNGHLLVTEFAELAVTAPSGMAFGQLMIELRDPDEGVPIHLILVELQYARREALP